MNIPCSLILLVSAHEVKLLRQDSSGGEIREMSHLSGRHLHDSHAQSGIAAHDSHGALHGGGRDHGGGEKERAKVVAHAIDALRAEWNKGGYDRIVMSAPDKMLGLLRREMPRDLGKHVSAELDKDLVKTPIHNLPDHLGATIRL